jgi:nitrate reductase NapE component
MDNLSRLRHAQQRVVRFQRRVWLAQILMWPTLIAAVVSSVGALVWILRRRNAGGRHEMPRTPGAHEAGTVQIERDGRLSHT